MQVIRCDECGEVLQRVAIVTEQTKQAAIVQLAKHSTDAHIMPWIERYLDAVDKVKKEMGLSTDDIYDQMRVRCCSCRKTLHEDSYRYVRVGDSTQLACSDHCLRASTT